MTTQRPRPRLLFGAVMAWLSIVGGRFIAPFLTHEAGFSDALVGTALAIASGIVSLLGPSAGALADARERRIPHRGRAQVLLLGITLGSVTFLLHGARLLFSNVALFHSVYWHFSLRLVFACAAALTFPVIDGLTLAHLEREEDMDRSDFGKERLYGAISWAVTNLVLGPFLDQFGFRVMYGVAGIVTFSCIGTILYYVRGQNNEVASANNTSDAAITSLDKEDEGDMSPDPSAPKIPIRVLLQIMLGTAYGAGFLFFYYCLNAGTSVVESLVFLFFEFLGGSYTMCSLTVQLTVLFEIPIFHYAPAMLNRYGAGTLQVIAGVAYVVRVIGYSLIPKGHTPYVLFLEPLHGVTYACSKTSAVEFVGSLMPHGYEASGQGLLGLFGGTGAVTGLMAGGFAEEALGPRIMYRAFATIVLAGMLVFTCTSCRKPSFQRVDLVPPADVELSTCNATVESLETFDINA